MLGAIAGLTLFVGLAATAVESRLDTPQHISVSIDTAAPGLPLPSDFLGLSYEVKDLPLVASLATHGDLVALLRSLGTGVLRFGGVTADSQVAWLDPATAALPTWATTPLVPADLYALARLTRATSWRVVLTVNLDHFNPVAAADEARVAKLALGSALKAIEIGNEPTAYFAEHLRTGTYTFSAYRKEINAYRNAIETAVPGLAIDGPDNEPLASNSRNLTWARAEARQIRPDVLTGHLYGASKCSRVSPTAPLLISHEVHQAETTALRELEGVAEAFDTSVWLDETNNISCGGEPGVSDTYSTALWALDLITRTLKAPFVGDAFHGFLQKPTGYSPIAARSPADLAQGALIARPEWYALLLAHQAAGDRPLPVRIAPTGLNVAVWAGRTPNGSAQVLIDNEQPRGSPPLMVEIRLGTLARSASILKLNGPSLRATTGVTLGGSAVSTDGSWRPATALHADPSHGVLRVLVTPLSAVAVTTEG
jgi:hypothetical protein